MGEKHKQKDKDKKRSKEDLNKKSGIAEGAGVDKHKGKDKKDKDKKKEKKKDKEKDNGNTKKYVPNDLQATQAVVEKLDDPPVKKLKAWQDDELEVDEDNREPSKLQALSYVAARSSGAASSSAREQEQGAVAEEQDPLDAFMADIAEEVKSGGAQGEGMGVMDASRVKSISLEEVQMLMGMGKKGECLETEAENAGPNRLSGPACSVTAGTEELDRQGSKSGDAPTSSATDMCGTPEGLERRSSEDDDAFHAAFLAEIKRQREAESAEFQAAESFSGARPGFVFKKGSWGLGYYRDDSGSRGGSWPAGLAASEGVSKEPYKGQHQDQDADGKAVGGSSIAAVDAWKAGMRDFRRTARLEGAALADDDENSGAYGEDNYDDDDDDEDEDEQVASRAIVDSKAKAAAVQGEGQPQDQPPRGFSAVLPDGHASLADTSKPEKVVETKKEKRRKRRETKEAEAKSQAEAAKQKAKQGFGDKDDQLMENDAEGSEQSSEEVQESYFDLVKRFTTKKTLPEVDHSKITYAPFKKNLYVQVKELTSMKGHEVDDLRRTHGEIRVRGKHAPVPIKSFLQCGLPQRILHILEKRDYEKPFPIQMQAIPALMCGRDIIGVAQTGSGKTMAYLLPMIRHILDQPKLADGDGPIGLVIAPTRELALQIQREASVFCKAVGLASVCAYGGGPMGEQLSALKRGAEILCGTPGRLIDVLTTSGGKITNLRRVTMLVLDEADRMFDMGFEPQIGMFLQATRPDKQVALFSATLPTHVEALARQVLKKPLEISVGERNAAATNVTQFVEVLEESQKFYRLLQLLGEWHEHGSMIIFVHQQKDVDEMFTELLKFGYPPLALHGGQDQQDRDFTLQDFKDGVSNILIATSVAARGIDVKSVILVINFKVPDHLEDYIHRIGRTGRAGKAGFAYTFIQPDEGDRAQDMVDALRQCGQEVPDKLKRLAEEYQSMVNKGQAKRKRKWGGFGGKGFKYDSTEKSRQQKERAKAKTDALIGENPAEEPDEFKDPWDEPDKPRKGEGKGSGKKDKEERQQHGQAGVGTSSSSVLNAAQIAAKLKAEEAKAAGEPPKKPLIVLPSPTALRPPGAPPQPSMNHKPKSDAEIEEQAQAMAEATLKNLEDEEREKRLPALKLKLMEKLKKADQELAKAAVEASRTPPPPPPKGSMPIDQKSPVELALTMVPGVIGNVASAMTRPPSMVSRSIEQIQAGMAKGVGTAHLAQAQASALSGGPLAPPGMHVEEFEINDYPEVARKRMTAREPLLQIEELTGAKLWVKGQHFNANAKLPEGARRLYVEIIGPTDVSVQRARREVENMMEALAIRTLNIPGASRAVTGTPGRYDPAVGK